MGQEQGFAFATWACSIFSLLAWSMCKSIWLTITTITMSALTTVRSTQTTIFAITTMNKHNKSGLTISKTTKT